MKKIICMFLTLLLLVCIVGCSQAKDSDNHVVQDYSEEYEVSPYGSEEALDTLGDLKISMSTEKDLDLKHLSFLIENTSDKEYQYSPDYFEIEAEQSGTWYQLKQLDDPSKSNEKDCFIKPNERLTLEIDVKSFYGELPAGHYRLIKQFAFFESERDWDYDTYNLSCEFTICLFCFLIFGILMQSEIFQDQLWNFSTAYFTSSRYEVASEDKNEIRNRRTAT